MGSLISPQKMTDQIKSNFSPRTCINAHFPFNNLFIIQVNLSTDIIKKWAKLNWSLVLSDKGSQEHFRMNITSGDRRWIPWSDKRHLHEISLLPCVSRHKRSNIVLAWMHSIIVPLSHSSFLIFLHLLALNFLLVFATLYIEKSRKVSPKIYKDMTIYLAKHNLYSQIYM